MITEQNKTKWITAKKKRTNIIPKLTARLTVSEPIDHLKLQACTTSKRNNHQSLVSHSPNDKLTILLFTCITNRIYGHVTTELRSRPSYTHTLFAVQSELYDFHPVIILLTLVFFFLCCHSKLSFHGAFATVLEAYQWLASQLSPHTVTIYG